MATTKLIRPVVKRPVGATPTTMTKKPTTPAKPTLDAWLAGDGTYHDQVTDTNLALKNALDDVNRQKADYQNTYQNDMRQLGWNGTQWNMADALTQSGRAFGQQAQDFAARGMLQSSGYGDNFTNLTRQLNDQVTNADTARQKYNTDLDAYGVTQNADALSAITQAKRAAIARYGAKYVTSANGALQ